MNYLHMFSSFVIMIILISLLIIVHEAGHFLAAKLVGIRVDKFGFGLPIGPTLFKKKIGETEFVVHAFLFGGYVSFPDDEEDCDLPKDSPLRYSNKSIGQRALVISMGVIFNVLLAYFLIFSAGLIWKHLPDNKYSISFEEFDSSAVQSVRESGIEKGDIIYSINGSVINYPLAPTKYFTLSKEFDGYAKQSIIENKLAELKTLNPELSEENPIPEGTIIKLPSFTDEEPVNLTFDNIVELEKYTPNETKLSDTQIDLRNKINYKNEYTLDKTAKLIDIAAAISDTKKPVTIVVLRNNEQVQLKPVYPDKSGKLGILQKFEEKYKETKTLKQLVPAVFDYVNYNMKMMLYSFGKLFTGKIPISEMNGIIAITKIGTEIIAYSGLFKGLLLTAIISLNLAILNILPIPALDGGHIMFLIIEKITGKPVNKEVVEKVTTFFFYLLIALIVVITYNDIHAWIIGKI